MGGATRLQPLEGWAMNRLGYVFAALISFMLATSTHAAIPVLGEPQGQGGADPLGPPDGFDQFTDPATSLPNWQVAPGMGAGSLAINDGHLSYTATSPSPLDFAAWQWKTPEQYTRPEHASWDFSLLVSMPQLSLASNQYAIYGLQMSTGVGSFFFYVFETNTGTQFVAKESNHDFVVAPATPGVSALRFRYDGASGDVFAEYDANGTTGGLHWTTLTSAPGLGNGFVSVFGQSSNIALTTASGVWGDDVRVVPEPSSWALTLAGLLLACIAGRRRAALRVAYRLA
jgi:hypothetical protein